MADDIAIKVDHVSKTFKLPHEKQSSIKGALISRFRGGQRSFERQKVLDDVSFEIKKGEFFGIVGRNGSGKSTLLKLLAGIYTPTTGGIQVNGKLTPFIELGVGFNPELTGRENVFLNGALLGFSRKEMEDMYDDIVEFAELKRFMDQKLKNYSSGMQVRLAFSIAIRARSDILLIDEVLAVGDAAFQTKCFDYFYELKKTGVTVVLVSHDRASLERFCSRGVLIHDGKMLKDGPISGVLSSYSTIVLDELSHEQGASKIESRPAEIMDITSVKAMKSSGESTKKFTYGEPIEISVTCKALQLVNNPIIGITVWKKNVEAAIIATNTLIEGYKESGEFAINDVATFNMCLPVELNDGEYYVEPAIANESATIFYRQVPKALTFFISGSENPHSILSVTKNESHYHKESRGEKNRR